MFKASLKASNNILVNYRKIVVWKARFHSEQNSSVTLFYCLMIFHFDYFVEVENKFSNLLDSYQTLIINIGPELSYFPREIVEITYTFFKIVETSGTKEFNIISTVCNWFLVKYYYFFHQPWRIIVLDIVVIRFFDVCMEV